MKVLKIELEAFTASFRQPTFNQTIHVSYLMPPPSTIAGLIQAATGQPLNPDSGQFGYSFSHGGTFNDLEHTWIMTEPTAKKPKPFQVGGQSYKTSMVGSVQPYQREQFFQPKLTLYLTETNFRTSFEKPHYQLSLGRSQDLACVTSVKIIDLVQADRATYQNTLVPDSEYLTFRQAILQHMPAWIDPVSREPTFKTYLAVTRPVRLESGTHLIDSSTELGVMLQHFS